MLHASLPKAVPHGLAGIRKPPAPGHHQNKWSSFPYIESNVRPQTGEIEQTFGQLWGLQVPKIAPYLREIQ